MEEVKSIKAFFAGSTTLQKLRYDEDERNLSFHVHTGKHALRFQFYLPDGYPDDPSPDERPVLMEDEGSCDEVLEQVNEFLSRGGSLAQAMVLLLRLLSKQFSLKVSRDIAKLDNEDGASEKEESSEEEESAMSSEEYFDEDLETAVHPRMRKDVEETESFFGKDSVKLFAELGLVRLFINTSFLSETVASALGIDCHCPLNITLHFGNDYLASSAPPTFGMDQKPKAEHFALQFQLTEILRNWLHQNWGKCEYATALSSSTGSTLPSTSSSQPSHQKKGSGFLPSLRISKTIKNNTTTQTAEPFVYQPEKQWPTQLKELTDMGFDRNISMYALYTTQGVLAESLNLCLDPQPWFQEEARKMAQNMGTTNSRSQATKSKQNFLISLLLYIRSRIANCSNYCPICDHKHECEGLKPIACSKHDCVWRYEELGLGANVDAELKRAPEIADLLISLACAAINSARSESVFNPFPMADFAPLGKKDLPKLKAALEGLPSLAELVGVADIRSFLDQIDPAPAHNKTYYRLLRWLLTSNRAHLVRLSEEQQIKEMSTPYQYMLLTATPEKESRFRQLKKTFGSFLAFHGSPMENWHSILRNGLRNLSNTKDMLHGAAHGAGIYLAPNAGTSQGYMRSGTVWAKSQFGASLSCLALCEVINHPDVYGRDHNQWCYVAKEDDHVMTRFFFIYAAGNTFPSAINARQLKVPEMKDFKTN